MLLLLGAAAWLSLVAARDGSGPQPPPPEEPAPESEPASEPETGPDTGSETVPTPEQRRELQQQLRELQERQRAIEEQYRNAQREIERQMREAEREMERRLREAREAVRQQELEIERREDAEPPVAPEPPERPRRTPRGGADQKFAFASTVKVNEGEVAGDIFVLGGGAKIDGEVLGGAVAVGGEIKVNGRVTGDVVAIGADVELGENAEVLGNAVSVGGQVRRADGARVSGQISEVGMTPGFDLRPREWWGDRDFRRRAPSVFEWEEWAEVLWKVTASALLLVLSAVVILVAPRGTDRVEQAALAEPWKALLVGLGVVLLSLPAMIVLAVLLVVSLIGIPLLVFLPFLVLLLVAAALYGYTAMAVMVGRWLGGRYRRLSGPGRFGALLTGVVAIQGLSVAGSFLDAIGIPMLIWGLFTLSGFLIKFLAWTTGLGAAVMSRFGSSPALPPLPEAMRSAV
ncbi:MAG TPA: polymer-forming cytoskeletal protein [Thermoanaerobaculia bacterium]|nr:polymer-forming cytoskeletal protein [Thermoanaerobaculia bacterium]